MASGVLNLIRQPQLINRILYRTYLSESFKCQNDWDKRLESPIFRKLKIDEFYFEIDRKFIREKRASHIDIDIFANAVKSVSEIDQLEDLLHRFRRIPQTFKTLPSTHHAVVRTLITLDQTDNLLRMIDDRFNFGLFLDKYSSIFLLEHFLKVNNFRDSAKVAIQLMLQEELNVPIADRMAVYGTLKYVLEDMNKEEIPWDPQSLVQEKEENEPEDEVKIRVKYLKPDYNDEHFDLTKREELIGKTLVEFSRARREQGIGTDSKNGIILNDSIEILGYALWGKKREIERSCSERDVILSQTVADKLKELDLETQFTFAPCDIFDVLSSEISSSVSEYESEIETEQRKKYADWNQYREDQLREQYELYIKEHRKTEISRKKEELKEREEKLFFFDKFNEMELEKEEKILAWKKTFPRKFGRGIRLKPKIVVSDDYKPPKII